MWAKPHWVCRRSRTRYAEFARVSLAAGAHRPGLGGRISPEDPEEPLPAQTLSTHGPTFRHRLRHACDSHVRERQKETAAWVEGGGTPRPPLEQSGSRPDGGGGRHRPAASSRDDAEFVPADPIHRFGDLTITISQASFIVEIEVSFLKWFNKVTRLGTTCDLWGSPRHRHRRIARGLSAGSALEKTAREHFMAM